MTTVASSSSSSSSSLSQSLRPPTIYLVSSNAGGQGARNKQRRKKRPTKPLTPEEEAEKEPDEGNSDHSQDTLAFVHPSLTVFLSLSSEDLAEEERTRAESKKKDLRPGARPMADGVFTVELDLSHFVRLHNERKQKTLMIIVADRSGSMKGQPWRQATLPLINSERSILTEFVNRSKLRLTKSWTAFMRMKKAA